jgi:hypothetical protein
MVCVEQNRDIPLPIVQLNRWVLVVGVVGGLILRQPLLTTALFLVVLSAVLFGRRGSLIFQAGSSWLTSRVRVAGDANATKNEYMKDALRACYAIHPCAWKKNSQKFVPRSAS